jgi:hypothetical protein
MLRELRPSIAPWSPSSLMVDWERLRTLGPSGFVIHYGLLRMVPVLSAPTVGLVIFRGTSLSLTRWLVLAAMFLGLGVVWGIATWQTCESRWHRARSTDAPLG